MKKLLLIGPLANKKDPSKSGGVVVLFELLLKELRDKGVEFDVIDTLKENYANPLQAFFSISFTLARRIKNYEHISLQATANSFMMIGPLMILLAKLYKKRTSMRKFAGNFDLIYERGGWLKQFIIRYVLKNSDAIFFETQYLVEHFGSFNPDTHWFPNVRRATLSPDLPRSYSKRLVYVGTVNEEKGIDELVALSKRLDESYTLDIYGPIIDTKYSKEMFERNGVSYKGALHPEKVAALLNAYDVLLLPTFWKGEGYPGVIIEAFSLGLPVIATRLKGIAEMVQEGENGKLVDAKSIQQLFDAVESIDIGNYAHMSQNAFRSFSKFDSKVQTENYLEKTGTDV
jgi:glycosyltransferase involved in cell wall biosynthesis